MLERILAGCLFLLSVPLYSQEVDWSFSIGSGVEDISDECSAVESTKEGNVYISGLVGGYADFDPSHAPGYSGGHLYTDYFLASYDQNKNLRWMTVFGTPDKDLQPEIALGPNQSVYIIGNFDYTHSLSDSFDVDPGPGSKFAYPSNYGMFFARFNQHGEPDWVKSLQTTCNGCQLRLGYTGADSLGNLYISGRLLDSVDMDPGPGVNYFKTQNGKGFMASYDSTGAFRWVIETPSISQPFTVAPSGDIYSPASVTATDDIDPGPGIYNPPSSSLAVIRYGSSGNFISAFFLPKTGEINKTDIDRNEAGNLILAMELNSGVSIDMDPGPGYRQFTSVPTFASNTLIAKFSDSGTLLWSKQITGRNGIRDLSISPEGDTYLSGWLSPDIQSDLDPGLTTMMAPLEHDEYIIRLNEQGGFAWGGSLDEVYDVNISTNKGGSLFIGGSFNSGSVNLNPFYTPSFNHFNYGSSDIFLMKISPYLTGISINDNLKITMAPNPANSSVTIRSDSSIETIEIIDLSGRILKRLSPGRTFSHVADISDLASGSYIVLTTDIEGKRYTGKLLKE